MSKFQVLTRKNRLANRIFLFWPPDRGWRCIPPPLRGIPPPPGPILKPRYLRLNTGTALQKNNHHSTTNSTFCTHTGHTTIWTPPPPPPGRPLTTNSSRVLCEPSSRCRLNYDACTLLRAPRLLSDFSVSRGLEFWCMRRGGAVCACDLYGTVRVQVAEAEVYK